MKQAGRTFLILAALAMARGLNGQGCPSIVLSPASLPGSTAAAPYTQALSASGGTAPYDFRVSSGSLPAGLTLWSSGLLHGATEVGGTYGFAVEAKDAAGCTGTGTYSIDVCAPPSATITAPDSLCPGSTGNSASVPDAGAGADYAWTIANGTITGGATGRTVTFTAGSSGMVTLGVTVAKGCGRSSSISLEIASPGTRLWAWRRGSDGNETIVHYGTKGVADPANVPGPRTGSSSWSDASGNLWLFGGSGNAGDGSVDSELNDLWKWDGTNWTWVSGSSVAYRQGVYGVMGVASPANVPGGRLGAASWRDGKGNLWLFGGQGYGASGYGGLNDLWKWDGAAWTWVRGSSSAGQAGVYGSRGVAAPGNVPGARYLAAAAWADTEGTLWLFGGSTFPGVSAGELNDLWRWDGTNWTWMTGSTLLDQPGVYGTKGTADAGNVPGARYSATAWTDAKGNFWVFGGSAFGDLWRWDGANWTWMSGSSSLGQPAVHGTKGVPSAGNQPGSRTGSFSWTDGAGNAWLFGGEYWTPSSFGAMNDFWRWDGTTWTWMAGSSLPDQPVVFGSRGTARPSNDPGGRQLSTGWVDASGAFWLFGGSFADIWVALNLEANDLWRWDGTNWTWMSGCNSAVRRGIYGTKGVPDPRNVPPVPDHLKARDSGQQPAEG